MDGCFQTSLWNQQIYHLSIHFVARIVLSLCLRFNCVFCWDVLVISFTVVLKLALAVSIGLFQTFCLNWLQFFFSHLENIFYLWSKWLTRMTLIGGPAGRAGWRTVFPNEKRELLAGYTEDRRGACTKRQSSGLRKRAGCRKGQPSGPTFSADQLTVKPIGPSCCAACRPVLLCSSPAHRKFNIFIWQHAPPARRPSI